FLMPWVFLHAIKDYAELPWIQSHYPSIKATYNLVPSLMSQLERYTTDWKSDRTLALLAKEPNRLEEEEKAQLLDKGFFANPRTMMAPLWRFEELHRKRSRFNDSRQALRHFDDQELTDLAVLFLLSWCGNQLRRENPVIKGLIAKGAHFTQEQKIELIDTLAAFCATVLPLYKQLQNEGKIAVFTTPFYHPILPLLLDLHAAKASDSRIATPAKWSDFSEDANRHVADAVRWYESAFGKKPSGFWPAEGAVSVPALELMRSHGVEFACTDEDVLFKNLPAPHYRTDLYKRYTLITQNGEMGLLFRDKALSDLIGFNYSAMDPQLAADDFMARLKTIHDTADFDTVVPVFLDGENAWEFYENNAFEFFNALYERLEGASWCKTVTIPEAHALGAVPKATLNALQPGSWIYGSLATWMGHSEKNRAWELLAATHEAARKAAPDLTDAARLEVTKELMIAEGSDWFWWYGDDHYTPLAGEFDELFRSHLRRVYHLLGIKAPAALNEPIKQIESAADHTPQSAPISPSIDGHRSSYFEWLGAGRLDLSRAFSAMDSSGALFKTLLYGTDGRHFYFQLSGNMDALACGGYELQIALEGAHKQNHRLRLTPGLIKEGHRSEQLEAGLGECLEFKLNAPLEEPGDRLEVTFLLYKQETLIQRIPLYNTLTLKMPEFDALWYI
ncbi:MAG: hypothetical protein AB7E49_10240, partial [Campylobacterales bacterium]